MFDHREKIATCTILVQGKWNLLELYLDDGSGIYTVLRNGKQVGEEHDDVDEAQREFAAEIVGFKL